MKYLKVYLKNYTAASILAPLFKMLEATFDLLVPWWWPGLSMWASQTGIPDTFWAAA